jgi:LysM repeat protein
MLCAAASFGYAQEDSGETNDESSDSAAPAASATYIIQSGDTLFIIAQQFNTTVEALKAANSISDGGRIIAGQALLIPAGEKSLVAVYEVQPGDTLYGISRRFNTSVGILRGLNAIDDASDIVAGQSILVPSFDENSYLVYIVDANDSLFSISRRFNTTVSVLKSLNGIADERDLETGQTILAPKIDETKYEIYEVKTADSLYSIARRFATSEDLLMSLNGIADKGDIKVGQTLLVPRINENDSEYGLHIVQSGDTLFDLSRLYNTTVAQLRSLNSIEGGSDLTVGRGIIVPRVDETILERYIVQPSDSLYSIAKRYDVDLLVLKALNQLADVRDIQVDQAILVPKLEGATLAIHVIQLGDTLEEIAEQYETTVELLQSLNGIADPSVIVLDKSILVPEPQAILARPGFGFGIQIFIDGGRAEALAVEANRLGVDWVKIDVAWSEIETAAAVYSYSALDKMIAAMELADLKIMLNIYDAPSWSRAKYTETLNSQFREYTGPPADYDDFAAFLANLVTRYAGLVDAYEIWKSPNLVKFWTAPAYTREQEMTDDGDYGIPDEMRIGARYYVPLLELAYDTIKSHDEEALVVAGGLAPAGFGDNYNSIDTGTFLNNMLLEGAAEVSDAIGVIFSASAVPPTLACCDKPPGVDTHYESFLQYYGDLLAFYDEILEDHEVDLPIIVTQLGWGTTEGKNLAVAATGFEWLNYTSEAEQALYVKQAYEIAQSLEYVSSIFLYNLNGCAVGDEEACFFSLEDADRRQRPVFAAYASVPKSADSA